MPKDISRKDFLKGVGAGAVSLTAIKALAGCTSSSASAASKTTDSAAKTAASDSSCGSVRVKSDRPVQTYSSKSPADRCLLNSASDLSLRSISIVNWQRNQKVSLLFPSTSGIHHRCS